MADGDVGHFVFMEERTLIFMIAMIGYDIFI
jgi:hypothetical protein